MSCENCRTSGCDGGPTCSTEIMWARQAGHEPELGPDGVWRAPNWRTTSRRLPNDIPLGGSAATDAPRSPDLNSEASTATVVAVSIVVGIVANIGFLNGGLAPDRFGAVCDALAGLGALLAMFKFRRRWRLVLAVTAAAILVPIGAIVIYFTLSPIRIPM